MPPESDHPEFNTIMREYESLVYSLSYRLTGTFEDAHDLFQETMIKAWMNWDKLENRDRPAGWLRRICTNTFIDLYRKSKIRPGALESDFPLMEAGIMADTPLPEDELLVDEHIRAVQSQCFTIMTTTLPLNQRIVFVLAHIFDVSLKDTSVIIDKSIPATKSLLTRARNSMKDYFGSCCNLVNPENACNCRSWLALQADLQGKREYIKSLISQALSADRITGADREKVLRLFATLPLMMPPPEWFEEFSKKKD